MATNNYIYVLYSNKDFKVRYVGKTININNRLKQHIYSSKNPSSPVQFWIASIMEKGFDVNIKIVLECGDDWQSAEIDAISKFRKLGCDLMNIQPGGNAPDFSKIKNNKLHRLKTLVCGDLRRGFTSDRIVEQLKYLVAKDPIEFSCFKKFIQ